MLKTSPDGRSGQSALAIVEKRLTGNNPDDSDIPTPVRRGVRFMLGGGAMTIALGVFWVIVAVADKNALINAKGQRLSNGQIAGGVAETFIFEFLLPAVIWVVMARYNRSGHVWARIVASVLCALDTYNTYGLINSLRGGQTITVAEIIYLVFSIATWILGVLAIAFVWRGESSDYFKARSARR